MLQFVNTSVWPRVQRRTSDLRCIPQNWRVCDSLFSFAYPTIADENQARVLSQLTWQPNTFDVTCAASIQADLQIDFPSPLPRGNAIWDQCTMDCHFARDRSGQISSAPGVVVLDILLGGNLVAGYIAKTLAKNGIHGFVLHLPQNGRRAEPGVIHDWAAFLPSLCQGAADARRARDVVASLPQVTGGVGLQGTSLGGFVATMAGAIDDCFDSVLLALTGGDVYSILSNGKVDAAKVRQHLRGVGYTDEKLFDALNQLEPLHIAHRLSPHKTWLFTARHDQVVPRIYSQKLAQAIGLDWSHHRQLAGCHYSCAINAHRFLSEMVRAVRQCNRVRRSA